MTAEIITIGDEILIGQIVDTNSAYMAAELNKIGVSVYQITSVQDDRVHILQALSEAEKHADIILITGGLGPTKDDITKVTLCEYLNDTLIFNSEVAEQINALFQQFSKTPPPRLNDNQSMVPAQAVLLKNIYGTAPGMWWNKNGKIFISLPGVPYEMKYLFQAEVLPKLQKKRSQTHIVHKTLLTVGLGESALAEMIESWENNLPQEIKLAYLPALGRVRLRLSAKGPDESMLHAAIDNHVRELKNIIGHAIVGEDNEDSIEEVIGNLLKEKKQTLSLAESCTGGQISRLLTKISGASQYYRGGLVTYATESKVKILGVDPQFIENYSVVSAQVAEAMAQNAQKLYESDYTLATTGNAGPDLGDSDAEIGTVYIGIATPTRIFSEKFNFGKERATVIQRASIKALELLRKEILKN